MIYPDAYDQSASGSRLSRFVSLSGSLPGDELFSYRMANGSKYTLRAKTVRQELKTQCFLAGLPPDYFSSHSLRKGAITHMRATGASEDDRRDRGGYAPNSQLMHSTYDYATGLGPLASSGLSNAVAPGVVDVLRLLRARR
jgi:integrase